MPRRMWKRPGDPTASALVNAVIDSPGDAAARAALLDYLLELGNPEESVAALRGRGHWRCVWHDKAYRLIYLAGDWRPFGRYPKGLPLTNVARMTRSVCPRCEPCDRTQPSADESQGWLWLCDRCRQISQA